MPRLEWGLEEPKDLTPAGPAKKNSHKMEEEARAAVELDRALEGEDVKHGFPRTHPTQMHQNFHPHLPKCSISPSRIPTGWTGSQFSWALGRQPYFTRKSKSAWPLGSWSWKGLR